MSKLLVTGGAGYIGSHACVELLQQGYDVVVLDNLSNSSGRSLEAVQRITQKELKLVEADLRDGTRLEKLFDSHCFAGVLHFAGLKSVAESIAEPARYYDNNINGTLNLIAQMSRTGVKTLVFSSSATVYGVAEDMPLTEEHPTCPISPYGRSKLMLEQILRDVADSDPEWRISLLRYFNPVGAHPSGEIGEDPNGVPNNLLPNVSQTAIGRREVLTIFGNEYPTPDGTCVRDYIHVLDLVAGHLKALEYLRNAPGCHTYNLGTGKGYSVLEVVEAFEATSGREIRREIADNRDGDAAESYADPAKANRDLKWQATRGIEQMCEDVWRWQSSHPRGFAE